MKAATQLLMLGTAFLLTEGCSEKPEPQHESSISLLKTGFVSVGEANLYYEEMGEGHPLVLLHGGFLDRRMWDLQFETNVDGADVVVMSGVAHMTNMEEPQEFNDIVLEFLARSIP